jgi:glycosyltransferase involved in cell wall biosynthesis
VHVFNFSQFLPVLRRFNPGARIGLHMQCDWLKQLDPSWTGKRLGAADLLLGCSDFVAEGIRHAHPQYADRCLTLYNGADVGRFSQTGPRADGRPDSKRILFVGRVSPEKGVHVLMRAFRRVLEHHPDAQLDVVGPTGAAPPEYIVSLSDDPEVRNLSAFYLRDYDELLREETPPAVAGSVKRTGDLPYGELVDRYRQSDIFVFPSVWHEPFGMPNVEAMACGLPVVATRGGGIPEIVADGETGFLVDRGDPDQLADALIRLLDDPPLRREMGEAGRRRARERFSWERIAADLLSVYG